MAPLSTWRVDEGKGGEVLSEIKTECQQKVKEIANELDVTQAQLLLRWGMQHGYSVLTKTSKAQRIKENLNVFNFEIPETDMLRLDVLNKNQAIAWAASGINPQEVAPLLK